MQFQEFTLKRVSIMYYEVKNIPIVFTSLIVVVGLIFLLALWPYEKSENLVSPNWANIVWTIITFLFLLLIVFLALYFELRKRWWRYVKRNLSKNDYVFENDYGVISPQELAQKILDDYPSVETDPDTTGLVVILYKDRYIIYQKFWGIK